MEMTNSQTRNRSAFFLVPAFSLAALVSVAGCAANTAGLQLHEYVPAVTRVKAMRPKEARVIVQRCCNDLKTSSGALRHKFKTSDYDDLYSVKIFFHITDDQPFDIPIKGVDVVGSKVVVMRKDGGASIMIRLKDIEPRVYVGSSKWGVAFPYLVLSESIMVGPFGSRPEDDERTKTLLDALVKLKQSVGPQEDDRAFAQVVADYRAALVKPVLPEKARRFDVQAKSAVGERNYDDAEDLYGEALDAAPWWPEGHFNRALVLSETGDYETAIVEMKRYLQLVPDAPDARAAQDKIYEWERKNGQ
jgi:tetratricopeptide (TPR) repeat protein